MNTNVLINVNIYYNLITHVLILVISILLHNKTVLYAYYNVTILLFIITNCNNINVNKTVITIKIIHK